MACLEARGGFGIYHEPPHPDLLLPCCFNSEYDIAWMKYTFEMLKMYFFSSVLWRLKEKKTSRKYTLLKNEIKKKHMAAL